MTTFLLLLLRLAILFIAITLILRWSYRPPENHVAVICRWNRFYGFLNPDRWTVLIPHIFSIQQEINLGKRTALLTLKDVYTKDRIPVDLDLKVYYSVDLRQANPASLVQALTLTTDGWEGLVKTNTTDLSRNVVVISFTFDELNSPRGRLLLKKTLSAHLSGRVKNMGVQVNPQTGVNLQNVQPNEVYRSARQAFSAAEQRGRAAAEQIKPIMEALYLFGIQPQDVMRLMAASTLAGSQQIPSYMFPDAEIFCAPPSQHRNVGYPAGKQS